MCGNIPTSFGMTTAISTQVHSRLRSSHPNCIACGIVVGKYWVTILNLYLPNSLSHSDADQWNQMDHLVQRLVETQEDFTCRCNTYAATRSNGDELLQALRQDIFSAAIGQRDIMLIGDFNTDIEKNKRW